MNTAIALILLSAAGPRVQVLWRIPLPAEAAQPMYSGNARFSALWDPNSGGVMWNSIDRDKSRVFWFDSRRRKVVPMGEGSFGEPQVDCDLGLATVQRYNRTTKAETGETYSLSTGKLLSTVTGRPKRVGRFVMTRDTKRKLTTYTDAVTGKVLWREDLWNDSGPIKVRAPLGIPIWVTPKRWLFIIGDGGRTFDDNKGVVDLDMKTYKERKRTHLSGYAFGFDGIVGNPERGTFAVFEASNRHSESTGIFRSDLTRVPGKFLNVTDITQHGILDREGKRMLTGDIDFDTIVCAEAITGKIRWRAPSKEPARWMGGNVLTGDRLLNGKTGRLLGKLKLPKKLLTVGRDGAFVGIDGKALVGGRIRAR